MPRAEPVPGQFGYAGLIKPYKGVERLVDAFAEASAIDPTLTLRISGKPANDVIERRLRAATERLSGLDMTLRYVSEHAFVDVVTSSELVVLPYRFMHNSGAALAALSLGRPVLVPDNDLNRALSSEVGPGWVHLFDGELTAANTARLDSRGARRATPIGSRSQRSRVAGRRRPSRPRLQAGHRPSQWSIGRRDRRRYRRRVARPSSSSRSRRSGGPRPSPTCSARSRSRSIPRTATPDAPLRCSILVIDNDPAGLGRTGRRGTWRDGTSSNHDRASPRFAIGRSRSARTPARLALHRRRRDPRTRLASRHDRDVHDDQADRRRRSRGDARCPTPSSRGSQRPTRSSARPVPTAS